MLDKIMTFLAALCAIALLVTGLGWLIDPRAAAANLEMPLLDGLARSSQVGDMTAFFIVSGGIALASLFNRNAGLMLAAALLLGATAVFRTTATLWHDAGFAGNLIAVEVVMAVIFLRAWWRMKSET